MSAKQDKQQQSKHTAARFRDLHETHYRKLLDSMTALLRDRETAEDITATALARAFENLEAFRGESTMFTWIYKIALNEARRVRAQKNAVSLDALESVPPELAVHERWDETQERSSHAAKMRKVLELLPPNHRRALVNHFVDGYPVKMIARRERIPVGTVLSRIFTAKRLLREAWG